MGRNDFNMPSRNNQAFMYEPQQGESSSIFEPQSYEEAPIKFEHFPEGDPFQQLLTPTPLPSFPPRNITPTDPSGKGKGRES